MGSVPTPRPISFYGEPSGFALLEWSWVAERLVEAGTYWVVANSAATPHPRPVWGIWDGDALVLSIGSPAVAGAAAADPNITVHLDSGTEVVVVEGIARSLTEPVADYLRAYDAKYEWTYSYAEYGPLTRIDPTRVLAWRSAGWAGRDGFQSAGSWRFD